MKRVFLAALGVIAVALWGLVWRAPLGIPNEWTIPPNATTWPLGSWGLPLAVLVIFGGAAGLSVYDRFKRAKSRKEQKNSVVTTLICLAILCFLLPWTLLGPGALSRTVTTSTLSRLTLEGRFNLLAAQWSDLATEYLGAAYKINDAREFTRTYAATQQRPTSRALSHLATHPPGATLWFYGVRLFVEGVPGLSGNLNALAVRLTAQDEPTLFSLLSDVRQTASLGAGGQAPAPLPQSAIGVSLMCVILMGLSLVVALPAVYGLATTGIDENSLDMAEARGLFACTLWVLAPTLNLYAFTLDAVIACGAVWTLYLASRAFLTGRVGWAMAAGVAFSLTTQLSFGALCLAVVLVGAGWVAKVPPPKLLRVVGWALGGFLVTWGGAAIWGGFNPLTVMAQATAAHRFATLEVRPYSHWVLLNLLIWAIFCGWPLIAALIQSPRLGKELIIRTGSRKEVEVIPWGVAFALATIATLVLLSLLGQVRGEVERLWLFLLAPLTASVLVRSGKEATCLAVLQGAQTLVMAATIAPLVRPF